MAILTVHHPLQFAFGLLGNIISFMVYLAPMPTFYRIYKKKTTEGFQSAYYIVALLSSMLWVYYAILKTNALLLITVNSFGCFIETIYIIMFVTYAPKKAKILTAKLLTFFNVGPFCLILIVSLLLIRDDHKRVGIVGWFCVSASVCTFVAPLSIVRRVIRTKSVEFMPFSLSFFLTLSAVMWFTYGLLRKDIYVAIPNILGFTFGVMQMILYIVYKNSKKNVEENPSAQVLDVGNQSVRVHVEEQLVDIRNHEENNMAAEYKTTTTEQI